MNAADDTHDQYLRLRSAEQAPGLTSSPRHLDNPEAASGATAIYRCHFAGPPRSSRSVPLNLSDLRSSALHPELELPYLVLLLKLEYCSLCIYMYVLSNPPVSIVYFFLNDEGNVQYGAFLLYQAECGGKL